MTAYSDKQKCILFVFGLDISLEIVFNVLLYNKLALRGACAYVFLDVSRSAKTYN